jgi:NTP pyrophosphatase (non-canonical NTP hydrolase)
VLKSSKHTRKNIQISVKRKWIDRLIGDGHKIGKGENRIMKINELCTVAFEIAKSKGWHDDPREMGTVLALIHSEVSEALEADRKGDQENFEEELADVCIRIFDLCGSSGIDLEKAIQKKMERNKGRSYKHGGKAY